MYGIALTFGIVDGFWERAIPSSCIGKRIDLNSGIPVSNATAKKIHWLPWTLVPMDIGPHGYWFTNDTGHHRH